MSMTAFLLAEFDSEMKKTRTALEHVPMDKGSFVPHPKSMPLNRLAPLVAQLPAFGFAVLTTPEMDFGKANWKPLPFESSAQLLSACDEGAAQARAALEKATEESWTQHWKLSMGEKVFFEGSRFMAYRDMFMNHLVHHRAQLGVWLRLNDKPVPATYGPSADDTMGL